MKLKIKPLKLLAVLLCLTLALGLFACGDADTEGENLPENANNDTATEAPEEEEPAQADDAEEPQNTREPAVITVYATNDLHGVVEGSEEDGIIGLPTVAGIAASTENAILIDAGDATQGASFATVGSGKFVIESMNAAGYDAMAAGNHDFDYGADALMANAEAAEFPILSANVMKDGEHLLDSNTVMEIAGYKIGIIGVTTTSTATSTNPEKLEGITFENEIESVKAQMAELSDEVDAFILVTHLGDNPVAANVTVQALLEGLTPEELWSIMAVVDGHSHTVEETMYGTVPIVQTGTRGTGLGVVTAAFNGEGSGFEASCEVWDYEKASQFELNEAGEAAKASAQAKIDECIVEIDPILAEELVLTGAPLWGGYIYYDYAEPRIVETTMGDLVTDAFKYYGDIFAEKNGVDAPVVGVENGGGISATLPYGIVTRGDVLEAFNHGNTVEVISCSPAQLYTALELGLTMTGQDSDGRLITEKPSGSFLQVSGFSYSYDPAGESGNKVVSVVLDDGTELSRDDEETAILVATNNYVTTFAGFSSSTKVGELGGEDELVTDYLLYLTNDGADTLTINNIAGRITIANDKSPDIYELVIPLKNPDGEPADCGGRQYELTIDNVAVEQCICNPEGIRLMLPKGPHTFYLTESVDATPVYVNNYSGSGTVTTADGYYHLYFTVAE